MNIKVKIKTKNKIKDQNIKIKILNSLQKNFLKKIKKKN